MLLQPTAASGAVEAVAVDGRLMICVRHVGHDGVHYSAQANRVSEMLARYHQDGRGRRRGGYVSSPVDHRGEVVHTACPVPGQAGDHGHSVRAAGRMAGEAVGERNTERGSVAAAGVQHMQEHDRHEDQT